MGSNNFFSNFPEKNMQKWLPFFCLFILSACAGSSEDISKQFRNNDQTTVIDQNTELMWAAADNRKNLTWQEAVDYCESYSAGGFDDWRMPRQEELSALFEAGIKTDGKMIFISGERVWAIEDHDTKGAFCHFSRGGCSWGEKVMSITMRALPVRDMVSSKTEGVSSETDNAVSVFSKPQTVEQRLQILDSLHKQKLITDDDYDSKKATILNDL